jgi:hypothetical protein
MFRFSLALFAALALAGVSAAGPFRRAAACSDGSCGAASCAMPAASAATCTAAECSTAVSQGSGVSGPQPRVGLFQRLKEKRASKGGIFHRCVK